MTETTADILSPSQTIPKAKLVFQDPSLGTLEGYSFGAENVAITGEVVFNTGMVG